MSPPLPLSCLPRRAAGSGRITVPTDFLDHPRPIAFAHRGGAAHFAENSWRAFEHAVKLGYAYLETDAHATSDAVLAAFPAKTLHRATACPAPITSPPPP